MSELLRIDALKADAERAADDGKSVSANPYRESDDPRRHGMWLTYYYHRVEEKLSHANAGTNSQQSHFCACC